MKRAIIPASIAGALLCGAAAPTRAIPFNPASPQVQAEARKLAAEPAEGPSRSRHIVEDHTGRKEVGKASYYAQKFQGRHMADGRRFSQVGHAAASKTLPIGTVAKVTNRETGQTAVVTVEDHGRLRPGRTIDVSRATAQQIGLTHHDGLAPVVVAPIAVPQRDGSVKPGAGALPGPATAK